MNTEQSEKLLTFLRQYSFDDLAKSFLAVSLWLPNISSQIKLQYMHVALEAVSCELSLQDRIKTFDDFKAFCKELFKLIPDFPCLEDYLPEADWGESDIQKYQEFCENLYSFWK